MTIIEKKSLDLNTKRKKTVYKMNYTQFLKKEELRLILFFPKIRREITYSEIK